MALSDFDRTHIHEILVNKGNQYDWFSAQLIRLIAKADAPNRALLSLVYPEHVDAYFAWFIGSETKEVT